MSHLFERIYNENNSKMEHLFEKIYRVNMKLNEGTLKKPIKWLSEYANDIMKALDDSYDDESRRLNKKFSEKKFRVAPVDHALNGLGIKGDFFGVPFNVLERHYREKGVEGSENHGKISYDHLFSSDNLKQLGFYINHPFIIAKCSNNGMPSNLGRDFFLNMKINNHFTLVGITLSSENNEVMINEISTIFGWDTRNNKRVIRDVLHILWENVSKEHDEVLKHCIDWKTASDKVVAEAEKRGYKKTEY